MNIVVSTGPAHPLFLPLVPLAWALRSRGHDVVVAAPGSFADVVARTGLEVYPVVDSLDMGDVMGRDREGNPVRRPDDPSAIVAALGRGFGRLAARSCPGLREVVEERAADVVIADGYTGATAALVSGATGVPWISQTVGPGDVPCRRWAEDEVAPEREAYGLSALPDPMLRIVNHPARLGDHDADWRDVPLHRMAYLPVHEAGLVPSWARTSPRPGAKRILVTLGSVQPQIGGLPALRTLIDSLDGQGYEMVVGVADHLVAALGQLPASVVACGWVPLSAALRTCAAIVHHGGPGTMMTALSRGVPQVIIPGPGKPRNAIASLAELGTAVVVEEAEVTATVLVDAVRRVVEEPAFREGAERCAVMVAADASPAEIARIVERTGRAVAADSDPGTARTRVA